MNRLRSQLMIFGVLLTGCFSDEEKQKNREVKVESAAAHPGEAIFKMACRGCHALDVPLDQRYDREKWNAVIFRMINTNGLVGLDEKGAELIVDYLTQKKP